MNQTWVSIASYDEACLLETIAWEGAQLMSRNIVTKDIKMNETLFVC